MDSASPVVGVRGDPLVFPDGISFPVRAVEAVKARGVEKTALLMPGLPPCQRGLREKQLVGFAAQLLAQNGC